MLWLKFGNYFVADTCTALYIYYFFIHERSGKAKMFCCVVGFSVVLVLCCVCLRENKMIWDGGGGYLFSSGGLRVLFSFCRWLYAGFICFWCVCCLFCFSPVCYIWGVLLWFANILNCPYSLIWGMVSTGVSLPLFSLFFWCVQFGESLERVKRVEKRKKGLKRDQKKGVKGA